MLSRIENSGVFLACFAVKVVMVVLKVIVELSGTLVASLAVVVEQEGDCVMGA